MVVRSRAGRGEGGRPRGRADGGGSARGGRKREDVQSSARCGVTCPADVYLYCELGGGRARDAPAAPAVLGVMQTAEPADPAAAPQPGVNGGRFDFDDGGTYCGGWEDHKANGHGVCTGPKGQGAYSGSWSFGFEVSGVYTWPSGSAFEGQWQNGKRHGLGVETRGRWLYRGEWTQGFKGRYGVRQSSTSHAKYEGTWAHGLQEGYGCETYADGGKYEGQWLRGMRHGYGVRASAPFGLASQFRGAGVAAGGARGSTSSLVDGAGTPDPAEGRAARIDESRGGFVLRVRSDEPPARRNSLVEKTKKGLLSGLMRKQRSTGELEKRGASGSIRSGGSASSYVSSSHSSHSGVTHASLHTDSSFVVEDEHLGADVTETYKGEWKNDKRTGFGVSERSDGLRYEGEWYANRKHGYGVTYFRDGTREEGKYKNNVLVASQRRRHMFLMRTAKTRERIDAAVNAAQRASKIALQKADIAISRSATARSKAEQADEAADQAKEDCELAQMTAKQFAPDFKLPSIDRIRQRERYRPPPDDAQPNKSILHNPEKSIPNHVPPPQVQDYRMANSMSTRRPSAAYPKTVQPNEPRFANGPTYPDSALAAPPNDRTYDYRNEAPANPYSAASPSDRFQQRATDQLAAGPGTFNNNQVPTSYRSQVSYPQDSMNYQLPPQADVNLQNYQQSQGGRRQSYQTTMQSQRQNQQEWNAAQDTNRRPSILSQTNQGIRNQNQGLNSMPNDYDHTDYKSGAMCGPSVSEGAPNRPGPPGSAAAAPRFAEQQFPRHPNDVVMTDSSRDPRQAAPRPSLTGQGSIDHFDHYKRPPSRDGSVDRFGRRSRQPSVEAGGSPVQVTKEAGSGVGSRAGSMAPAAPQGGVGSRPISRAATPASNGHLASARGSISRGVNREPFEESLLRKRNLGQEISPSPYQPKRTESLLVAGSPAPTPLMPTGGGGGRKMLSTPQMPLQRKKSLPEVQQGYQRPDLMSREEVSALGSARREEVRRMAEESERLRANPLLYLVSPQVKEWFSRQQLVILVLFVNISLAIMFFKLLT